MDTSPAGDASRPAPRVAYERWLDALARAGWTARPGGPAGGPAGQDSERVAVAEALGRITAAAVTARRPSPRTDCAAMDGVAVRAASLTSLPARLPSGTFEWIDTGDPMPDGADTVVMRERLLPQADGSMLVTAADGQPGGGGRPGLVTRGQNVRAAGEDFAAGEILVPPGRRLRPGDLAAVAAGGHVTVAVTRRPVVAIVPTGDEIRPLGAALRRGDIIDTNSLMLAARCAQLGVLPSTGTVVADDPDALAAELRRTAAEADLVLIIAGSSRGRGDHAAAVLEQVGCIALAGVAVRPGHPAILGHVKPGTKEPGSGLAGPGGPGPGMAAAGAHRRGVVPAIGLPGYPLATAVIFELFAVPLLSALQGQAPAAARVRARLDRDWVSPAHVEEWVLVTLTPAGDGGSPLARPARRGAGSISQLARGDAWWAIPVGQGEFRAGTEIDIMPVPQAG